VRRLACACALLAIAGAASAEPALLGPAPRDEDGRFLNLAGPLERAGPSVTVPFFARRVFGFMRQVSGVPERAAGAAEEVMRSYRGTPPLVTWIGHATLLLHHDGVTYLTDPQWSKHVGPAGWLGPRRFVPPGVPLEALPPIDFVVISHNHYDHLDLPTLTSLAALRPETVFLVPLGNALLLRKAGITNVEELDWGQTRGFGAATIHCLPTRHWSSRGLNDERRALWSSWAITGAERRVYFAGDTGFFPEFEEIGVAVGPFDLGILPIGAYEPVAMMQPVHLNPEEAVAAADLLRAKRSLGMHFGTFDLTDEPVDEPPKRFRAAAEVAGWEPDAAWVLRIGETRRF
jgi:N-acyl-phosphatidylethanolamine-hydrolysing phospholipase D